MIGASRRAWRVRVGADAELDFANILRWTAENFGSRQALFYRDTLLQTIADLAEGTDIVGSKARDEIMRGLRTLHVARHGRRGRHFLAYRVQEQTIEIVRILHGAIEIGRHLPSAPESNGE